MADTNESLTNGNSGARILCGAIVNTSTVSTLSSSASTFTYAYAYAIINAISPMSRTGTTRGLNVHAPAKITDISSELTKKRGENENGSLKCLIIATSLQYQPEYKAKVDFCLEDRNIQHRLYSIDCFKRY